MSAVVFLIGLALGVLFGIGVGVFLRDQDEQERQERVRRMHREGQR